jgi:iron-sulfur cluster assembly protein
MDITFTEKALSRFDQFDMNDKHFLRLSVKSGGCAGMTYDAIIDDTMTDGDEVLHAQGAIRVVSDPKSSLFLDGLNIDYSDDLIQAGFRLSNHNSNGSCGCGASFTV